MIENNGKKYYTAVELLELINNPETEIHKAWKNLFSNYEETILVDQVSRIVYEAKKINKVSYVEFCKTEGAKKKFLAFLLEDVIDYIKNRAKYKKSYNLKFFDKEI